MHLNPINFKELSIDFAQCEFFGWLYNVPPTITVWHNGNWSTFCVHLTASVQGEWLVVAPLPLVGDHLNTEAEATLAWQWLAGAQWTTHHSLTRGLVPAPVSAAPARPDPAPATGAARPATADMTGGQSRAGEVSFKNNDALFMVQYNRKCSFEVKLQLIWPTIWIWDETK